MPELTQMQIKALMFGAGVFTGYFNPIAGGIIFITMVILLLSARK